MQAMCELNLLVASTEGALLRVLGTIERRGFTFAALSTQATAQGMRLSLTLSSDGRAAEVLLRQLRRLVDVREAALELPRPSFELPRAAQPAPPPMPVAVARRSLSYFGIPERVSSGEVFA
jgi:acetolactate synthase II small subunit